MADRSCGTCALCCKLLAIKELQKPEREWCPHCRPGQPHPCTIYDNRPSSCVTWKCLWLHGLLPEEMKPDRIKVVLWAQELEAGEGQTQEVLMVNEGAPGAADHPKVQQAISLCVDKGMAVMVVLFDGRRRLLNAPLDLRQRLQSLGEL